MAALSASTGRAATFPPSSKPGIRDRPAAPRSPTCCSATTTPPGACLSPFYKSVDQIPPFTDYAMKGKTYRFFEGEPLYPFGYGLSYTSFAYSNLQCPRQAAGAPLKVTVDVRNIGQRAGEEVVEVYLGQTPPPAGAAIRSLVGFRRVALAPGESTTVEFSLQPEQIAPPVSGGESAPSALSEARL